MNRLNIELVVGLFLLVGLGCFFFLAMKLGNIGLFGGDNYTVTARFTSVSGLKEGAFVELAGVRIGKVTTLRLDPEEYDSVVEISIPRDVILQDDSIAAIRTSGIIGDRFVKLTPGGSEELIEDGGEIIETEPSISLEELISKYIFESDSNE